MVNCYSDRLYSQWLNPVIYSLIKHYKDWTQIGVTSIGRMFDFHDVIYHIQLCNVDNRYAFQSKQELWEILTLCSRWRNRYRI